MCELTGKPSFTIRVSALPSHGNFFFLHYDKKCAIPSGNGKGPGNASGRTLVAEVVDIRRSVATVDSSTTLTVMVQFFVCRLLVTLLLALLWFFQHFSQHVGTFSWKHCPQKGFLSISCQTLFRITLLSTLLMSHFGDDIWSLLFFPRNGSSIRRGWKSCERGKQQSVLAEVPRSTDSTGLFSLSPAAGRCLLCLSKTITTEGKRRRHGAKVIPQSVGGAAATPEKKKHHHHYFGVMPLPVIFLSI